MTTAPIYTRDVPMRSLAHLSDAKISSPKLPKKIGAGQIKPNKEPKMPAVGTPMKAHPHYAMGVLKG